MHRGERGSDTPGAYLWSFVSYSKTGASCCDNQVNASIVCPLCDVLLYLQSTIFHCLNVDDIPPPRAILFEDGTKNLLSSICCQAPRNSCGDDEDGRFKLFAHLGSSLPLPGT